MIRRTLWLIFFCVLCLWTQAAHALDWYNSSWPYRKKITIDYTKVPNTNQSNFPVLISRTDTDWKDTANGGKVGQSDGGDFVFTSSDGTTKLYHEIEKYTNTSGALVAWVNVTTLSASANTVIYAYYGNASCADQWSPTNVWDSNFKMVQHFNEDPSSSAPQMIDSTSNDNDGTSYGSMTSADQVTTENTAGSLDFDGSNDYIDAWNATASLNITSNITIEALVYPTLITGKDRVIVRKSSVYYFQIDATGKLEAYFYGTTSPGYHQTTSTISLSVWTHVAVTYNGSNVILYINGSSQSFSNTGSMVSNLDHLNIGAETATTRQFQGQIDEVRISSGTVRSADWIATGYNNQISPSTFYSVGGEERCTTGNFFEVFE